MSELRALLIGIDHYLPNEIPDMPTYHSLKGCVNDVDLVQAVLQKRFGLNTKDVIRLVVRTSGIATQDLLPTYENIVNAFKEIIAVSQPQDYVYIHYSGHGGRVSTIRPDLKDGVDGIDEALVPYNIGSSSGRYVRDFELAYLIDQMVQKGLNVTVAFDCCHSGGATRNEFPTNIRGIPTIDNWDRRKGSLVTPSGDEEAILRQRFGLQRSLSLRGMPEPQGYVFLAACLPHEHAREGTQGVFTEALMTALWEAGENQTYRQLLNNQLIPLIRNKTNYHQTPNFWGEIDRIVFNDVSRLEAKPTPVVLDVKRDRVTLDVGKIHGVQQNSTFAIYPIGTTNFDEILPILEVTVVAKPSELTCIAQFHSSFGNTVAPGCPAVMVSPGSRASLVQLQPHPEIEEVRNILTTSRFIKIIDQDSSPAMDFHYSVQVVDDIYQIFGTDLQLLTYLDPPLYIHHPASAIQVAQRLIHLTKFRNVKEITNIVQDSNIRGWLDAKLYYLPSGYQPTDSFKIDDLEQVSETIFIHNQWICLSITNTGSSPINFVVLALQADWSIVHLYPQKSAFDTLDPGRRTTDIRLCLHLMPEYSEAREVLKIIATTGSLRFDWLTLPALNQKEEALKRGSPAPENSLEALFATLTQEEMAKPSLYNNRSTAYSWTTVQFELITRRGK